MSYDEHLISMAGGDGEPDTLDLNAIQARADAATKGPWRTGGSGVVGGREYVAMGVRTDPDAEFIAHARTDVPALLALVREQQARIDAVSKILDEKYKLWAAICGNTCSKDIVGVDHDAIADEVAAAIRSALEPNP